MAVDIEEYGKQFYKDYVENDFEVILTKYRKKTIKKILEKYATNTMLEIGCGMEPFFLEYENFDNMYVVEPSSILFESALNYSKGKENIKCINNFLENTISELKDIYFDCILLVGLIHEVEDPVKLVGCVRGLCNEKTTVIVTTNNPNSLHLTLAYESGLIPHLGGLSDKAKQFQRHNTYTMSQMKDLLESEKFTIIDEGSYFIKPFSHAQMKRLLDEKIISMDVIDGLDKMIKYMPEFGAENYCVCKPLIG